MRRPLLLLALLAAAVPAAAGAQTPVITAPVATTGAAEAVAQTGATLTGTVDRNGGPTTYHFEYGTSTAYGLTTPETAVPEGGTDPVTVKAPVQGLTRATTYHYRLVATNPAGISRGADRSFRTATGPRPPGVSATGSRDVGARGARLITTVDPNAQATSVRFEYGRSTRYGSRTDPISAGSGDGRVPLSTVVSGLQPNTLYHFRAIATNAAGESRSRDRRFRTARELTGISLTLTPARVRWGSGLTVIGRVLGSGVGGTRLALERRQFPFGGGFTQLGGDRLASGTGAFRFDVPALFATTQFRVVSRTPPVVASGVLRARSALRVSAQGRSRGRRRARVKGTIAPQVPAGSVWLQKRSRRGHWSVVRRGAAKPLDGSHSRYGFTVRRGKRVARYRVLVLARDGGAHVPGRSRVVKVRARRG